MAIEVVASINSTAATAGAATFNAALSSMRSGVAATGKAIQSLQSSFFSLKGAIGAVAAVAAVEKAVALADSYQLLQTRLAATSGSAGGAARTLEALSQAAGRAHVPVADLAAAYGDMAAALKEKGRSEAQGIGSLEALTNAAKASGATNEQTADAYRSLASAVNSGRIEMGQFFDLGRKIPILMEEIQRQTGMSSVQLRRFAELGKISGLTLVDVLSNAAERIKAKVETIPRTAADAFNELTGKVSERFAKATSESGSVSTFVAAFDRMKAAVSGPEFAEAARTAADFLTFIGKGLQSLSGSVADVAGEVRVFWHQFSQTQGAEDFSRAIAGAGGTLTSFVAATGDAARTTGAFLIAIADTSAVRVFASALEGVGVVFGKIVEGAKLVTQILGSAATQIFPETTAAVSNLGSGIVAEIDRVKTKTAELVRQQETFSALRKSLFNDEAPAAPKAAEWKTSTVSFAESEVEKQAKLLLKIEQDRYLLSIAQRDVDKEAAANATTRMEIQQKITKDLRDTKSPLIEQLEAQIKLTAEVNKQAERMARTRAIGEQFGQTVVDAFSNAAKSGQSFTASLRDIVAKMVELTVKVTILDPLIKNIGKSFNNAFPSFDSDKGLLSFFGIGQTANTAPAALASGGGSTGTASLFSGSFFADGGVFTSPINFTSGGMRGQMAEAGPEAIMPLRRGADGALGVVSDDGVLPLKRGSDGALGVSSALARAQRSNVISFLQAAEATRTGKNGSAANGPVQKFAKGAVFNSPIDFQVAGMQGHGAEAGRGTLLPLRRGAAGSLGVSSTGGSAPAVRGGDVYISVAGDATAETVAKLRQVARQEFAKASPDLVRTSVSAVAKEHRANNQYLRR